MFVNRERTIIVFLSPESASCVVLPTWIFFSMFSVVKPSVVEYRVRNFCYQYIRDLLTITFDFLTLNAHYVLGVR